MKWPKSLLGMVGPANLHDRSTQTVWKCTCPKLRYERSGKTSIAFTQMHNVQTSMPVPCAIIPFRAKLLQKMCGWLFSVIHALHTYEHAHVGFRNLCLLQAHTHTTRCEIKCSSGFPLLLISVQRPLKLN